MIKEAIKEAKQNVAAMMGVPIMPRRVGYVSHMVQ
jgi:hypothetical protein